MSARAAPYVRTLQVLLALGLALWVPVLLRPIGYGTQWSWVPRPEPPLVVPLALAGGVLLLALAAGWAVSLRSLSAATGQSARASGFLWRLLLALGSVAFPLLLYASTPGGWPILLQSAASDVSCEYFGEALGVDDPVAYCREYGRHQAGSRHHLATHPPGAVVLYWAGIQLARVTGLDAPAARAATALTGRGPQSLRADLARLMAPRPVSSEDVGLPVVLALLFSVLGALCVWPAAGCARLLWDEEAEFPAASLVATVPALGLHFQNLDVPLALCLLLALWAALGSVRRPGWAVVSGVLLGLGAFVSFGALAGVGLCGLTCLLARWEQDDDAPARAVWGRGLVRVAGLLVGFAGAWLVLVVALGLHPADLVARSGVAHRGVIEGFHRAYGVWVWMNLVEFACFLGPPLLLLAAAGVADGWRVGGAARALAVAAPLTLLALDLSGTVRAEVGRIWLPLMLPLAVLSAGSCRPSRLEDTAHWRTAWQTTVLLQLLVCLALAAGLHPVVRPV